MIYNYIVLYYIVNLVVTELIDINFFFTSKWITLKAISYYIFCNIDLEKI